MADAPLVVISVVRDFSMYARCVGDNPQVAGLKKVVLDNSQENLPIPVRYNRYLDEGTFDDESWLMFCHEDFELQEPVLPCLAVLDRECLYGPVGSARVGLFGLGFQRVYGVMSERNRDGSGAPWRPGFAVRTGKAVETLDCCCLLVHASLVRRCRLRFDERLEYDLYVEDFCAASRVKHGVRSKVLAIESCHHSGSRPTERLFRHLPYLERKYPRDCFSATCAYFGRRPLLMRLEDRLLWRRRTAS